MSILGQAEQETIKVIAQVSGIGGVAIGGMVLIFRDVIQRNIFPKLTREHAFQLIRLIVILSFLMAIMGVGAWTWVNLHPTPPKPESELDLLPQNKRDVVLAARAQIEKAERASEFARDAAKSGEEATIAAQNGSLHTKVIIEPCSGYQRCKKYQGEWDSKTNRPNGFGSMIYILEGANNEIAEEKSRTQGISGEKFTGVYNQGVRVRGVFTYPHPIDRKHPYGGALKYEGDWAPTPNFPAANWNGYGTVKYRDGSTYRGQIIDGNFSGYGVFTKTDQTKIEGRWSNGAPIEGEFVAWDANWQPILDYHWVVR